MAEIYITEEEQVERFKRWIKEYAPTIIISILIVVMGTFGWRYWNRHTDGILAAASNSYEQLLSSEMNNTPGTATMAEAIITNYSKTPYAKLAALLLAKQDIANGDMTAATNHLQWVLDQSGSDSIKQIARNRLARLEIAESKPNQAISLLQKIDDSSYLTTIDAIRGDAYVALGQYELARQAYVAALKTLPVADDSRPLLEMKLNDLPA